MQEDEILSDYENIENEYLKSDRNEEETVLKKDYDELLERYNLLLQLNNTKDFSFIDASSGSIEMPDGVTEAYIIFSKSTNIYELVCGYSGSIIISSTEVLYSTNVLNYGWLQRASLEVFKIELNGNAGTINLSASGGDGSNRSWTAIVAY